MHKVAADLEPLRSAHVVIEAVQVVHITVLNIAVVDHVLLHRDLRGEEGGEGGIEGEKVCVCVQVARVTVLNVVVMHFLSASCLLLTSGPLKTLGSFMSFQMYKCCVTRGAE